MSAGLRFDTGRLERVNDDRPVGKRVDAGKYEFAGDIFFRIAV